MKLSELVSKNLELDVEITGIKTNSKNINKGDLFVCVMGANTDRHDYIEEAINNGASALIVSKDVNYNIPTIKVDNTNESLKSLLNKFYNNPLKSLKVIGITGTDGKTTTTKIIQELICDDETKKSHDSEALNKVINEIYFNDSYERQRKI